MKIFFVIAALALVEGRLNVPAFGPSIPMRRSGYNHVGNADNQNLSPVTYSDPLQTGLQYAQEHSPAQGGLSFVLQSHSRAKSTGV